MLATHESLARIAQQFDLGGAITRIESCGGGKINDTYIVDLLSGGRCILQRLNPLVFPVPAQIMKNLRIITEHMAARISQPVGAERWEIPIIYRTRDGQDFFVDQAGDVWRAMSFIAQATAYSSVQHIDHAREAGAALGRFHCLLADLDPGRLSDTLPGFHITPDYLKCFDQALAEYGQLPAEALGLARFVADRRWIAELLEQRKAAQLISPRIMHGDPRLNNIMIDDRTGRSVALIDLDTVKPGLIQYDIGDLLRSACNPVGGEAVDLQSVQFDTELYRAILTGYLAESRTFVSDQDLEAIPDSVQVIAFELGLRYLTDFLKGNVYFKVKTPRQNLFRAAVQFKLVEQIEAAMPRLVAIVAELR